MAENEVRQLKEKIADLEKVIVSQERTLTESKKELEVQAWGVKKTNEGVKTLYKVLEDKNKKLLKLDELKTQFVSTVSHELRTPLAVVKEALFNLNDGISGKLEDQQKKIVDIADRNVSRLERLISDILDLSRLESGIVKLKHQRVKLDLILHEIQQNFQIKTQERDKELSIEIPDALPELYVDSDMFMRVIINLIDNALRFCKKEIKVLVSQVNGKELLDHEGLCIQVSIVDDGIGISKENLDNIFNKFTQINRPVGGSGYKGTGLGLSIVYEIMELHHGKVTVESKEGEGTQFHLVFPILKEEKILHLTIQSLIENAKKGHASLGLILISIQNMDQLKTNQDASDVFFEQLENWLRKEALRSEDKIFSYTSRKFMIGLIKTSASGAEKITERIKEKLKMFYCDIKGVHFVPEYRLGLALYPDDATDAKGLVELALQQAKNK